MPKFHLITEKLSKNIRLKILSKNTAAFSSHISKISRENNVKRCTISRFFAFLINVAVLYTDQMRKILCVTDSLILIYVRKMVRYVDFKIYLNIFLIGQLTFYASFESKNRLIQNACFYKKNQGFAETTGHLIKNSGTSCTDDTRVKVPSFQNFHSDVTHNI